ncbi:MAG: hypothetical protein JXR07_07685 [Reichenbachiella sp.]
MKNKLKQKRLNLTLEDEFYQQLNEQAMKEYLLLSTYVKRFLKKNLSTSNNSISKNSTQNEQDM